MKKLMIAALALCAAYGAQAMAVDWKTTGKQNYKAYLIIASAVSSDWANEAAVAAASAGGAHKLATKSGGNYSTGNVTTKDNSLSKSGNFYVVIVDADGKQFAVSSLYSGASYVYNNESDPPESSPGTLSWAATSATFKDFSGGGDVPEPTSAMLLLLGVAGLALKRKVA